jgi:hypothetical protein
MMDKAKNPVILTEQLIYSHIIYLRLQPVTVTILIYDTSSIKSIEFQWKIIKTRVHKKYFTSVTCETLDRWVTLHQDY